MMATRDMTTGNPGKLILGFSLPLMAGNIFQQLYTFADTMIVGQALGVNALAALGAAEWMIFLLFGTIQGLTQGFSVITAQRFGGADYKGLRKAVINSVYLSAIGALLLTAAGQAIIYPLLRFLGTPEQIIDMTGSYLRILYGGIPITVAYNLSAAVLRALGNSKTPLKAVTIASLCNIVLDLIFVFAAGWGIAGAAGATLLAQLLATVFCLAELRKIQVLKYGKEKTSKDTAIDFHTISEQLIMGIPMGLQNVITAAGGLIVQSVINGFGVLFIAGYTAANKLYGLLEIAASSYGYAMSAYAGQNMGAGLLGRIKKGLFSASVIGGVTGIIMSTIMLVFGRFILGCFITGSAETIDRAMQIGYHFLVVLACFFPLLYILYVMRACIQGMGNSVLPMISSVAQLIMRCGCALLLPHFIGESGVFWGEIFAWIGADIILLIWIWKKFRDGGIMNNDTIIHT